jgi:hypothetical protein
LHDETTADGYGHREHERAGIYPTPRADIGIFEQDQEADGGARQAAHRLKPERRQHHPATNAARDALGNHEVGGRIVAPERDADPQERPDRHRIGRTERQHRREDAEQHHFDDEHLLAAIPVSQPAERRGADEDAEQRGRGDNALLGRTQGELLAHKRQGHAGGEDHHAFEELAGGGQSPDQPLHPGDRSVANRRRVRPERRFIDVALDGSAGDSASARRAVRGHGASRGNSVELRVGDDPGEEREARPADRALQAWAAMAGFAAGLQQKDFVALTRC